MRKPALAPLSRYPLGRPRGGFIRRRGGLVSAAGGKAPALVGFADGVAPDLDAMAGSGANLAGLVLSQGCPNQRLQRTRRASANGAEHSPSAAEPPAVRATRREPGAPTRWLSASGGQAPA